MSIYPEVNLAHVHPPSELVAREASRFLSENDERRLAALLHAVLHTAEDKRFDWPEVSRGGFCLTFAPKEGEEFSALSFRFAGSEPTKLKRHQFSLNLDDGERFVGVVEVQPPEILTPRDPGWHALCLAKNMELELSFAALTFFEVWRPHNKELQRSVLFEKDLILATSQHSYSTNAVWRSHVEELERCVKDALNGAIYAPAKANWGLGRVPDVYRDYCAWFKQQEEK